MKKTCSIYISFQVLNIYVINICKIEPLDLLFLVVFISFYISRYIIFHKCLELHSILSVKKIFVNEFSFLTDSLKLPHSLYSQNPLSVTKVFCQCSLKIYDKVNSIKQQLSLYMSKLLK